MSTTKSMTLYRYMATPGAPTVTPQGTGGATTYGYKVVAKDANGGHSIASAEGSTAGGNATLDGTNYNRVSWTAVPGATSYDVYRTTGGATQGLIGSVDAPTVQLDDTGLVGDLSTAPADNTSGKGAPRDVLHYDHLQVQIGGTFVGEVQVEGSINNVEWEAVTSPAAAPALLPIPSDRTYAFLRIRELSYTSGTPTAVLAGHARGS